MKRKGLVVFLSLVLALSLIVAGCAKPAPEAPETVIKTGVIKIGVSVPLSGWGAGWGITVLRPLEMLADKVDEAGGIDIQGVKYTIQISAYDNKYSATEGLIIAHRLISQDEVLIIATAQGPPSMAARDLMREAGVIRWGVDYVKEEPSPEYPLAFSHSIRYPETIAPGYAWFVNEYPELKTTARVVGNMNWAQWSQDATREHAIKHGLTVVAEEIYETGTQDFTAILLKVLATEPDFIDVDGCPPNEAGLIIKQARTLGYTGPFVGFSGINLPVIMDIAGAEYAEGVISGLEMVEPYPPLVQEVVDRHQAKYGERMEPIAIQYYAGHETLLQAIEQAQSLDTAVIAETLRTGEFDTIIGKAWFGGKEYYGIDNHIQTRNPIARVTAGGNYEQLIWLEPATYSGYCMKSVYLAK